MTVPIPVVMMCSSGVGALVPHLHDTHGPRDVTAMRDDDLLAAEFEDNRDRLTAVASRLLGSRAEAEDAVQEAWLRGSRAGGGEGDHLAGRPATGDTRGAGLAAVVARRALTHVGPRPTRAEAPLDEAPPAHLHAVADPAEEA